MVSSPIAIDDNSGNDFGGGIVLLGVGVERNGNKYEAGGQRYDVIDHRLETLFYFF